MRPLISLLGLSLILMASKAAACGSDGTAQPLPDQAKDSAAFVLENVGETMHLSFQGKLAESVFQHLSAKALQTRKEDDKLVKEAVGIRCEYAGSSYKCLQVFDPLGRGKIGLRGLQAEEAPPYITLEYKGKTAQNLFDTLTAPASDMSLDNGETVTRKTGARLSCDRNKKGQETTYRCVQYMINNGFSWGDGIDPIINVGTHSLVMELSDEGIVQRPVENVKIDRPAANEGAQR